MKVKCESEVAQSCPAMRLFVCLSPAQDRLHGRGVHALHPQKRFRLRLPDGLQASEGLQQLLPPGRADARNFLQPGMDRRLSPQRPVVNDAEAVSFVPDPLNQLPVILSSTSSLSVLSVRGTS